MKRPLCMFSLVFIAAVFLMLKLFPIPLYKDKEADKSMLEITGQVYAKEQKGDTNVIYLKSKSDRLICYMEGSYMPRMGSYVTIKGKYKGFSTASNPGQFNQKKYYQILNLNFSILNANIIQETKEYNRFKEAIYKIRRTWANSYERCMHTKEAGVLKAMILGDKSELDADLKNLYKQAGISHILAISGVKTLCLVSPIGATSGLKWAFVRIYNAKKYIQNLCFKGQFLARCPPRFCGG